jgi:CubicO group peptidase (beta-lactamase class C family)
MSYRMLRSLGLVFMGLIIATPSAAQLDSPRLEAAVDSIVGDALGRHQSVSYAVGVKRGREVIVSKGYGLADLEDDVYASSQTIYRLGSITKQFTAAAIMRLVEQGKVSLDDELTKFIPDYPTQGHRVTVHHLLTHTSGIKSYTGLGEVFWNNSARDLTHEEMLDLFKDEPFDFAPGEEYRYNNSGFYLLGMIVEKVDGNGYGEYLQQNVFGPLELSRTSYCHEDDIIKGRAQGYRRENDQFLNDKAISMNTPGAAGALCSTTSDLLGWQEAFNEGRVVSAESRERMITPATLSDGSETGYGYGLGIGDLDGHPVISHGGGINGFNTQRSYYPDEDLTVVVLANTEGSNPGRVARDIARLAIGLALPKVKDLSLGAAVLSAYEGQYELGEIKVDVTVEDARLFMEVPGQGKMRLMAQGDHGFALEVDPEIRVTFEVADDLVTSMTLRQGGGEQVAKRVR